MPLLTDHERLPCEKLHNECVHLLFNPNPTTNPNPTQSYGLTSTPTLNLRMACRSMSDSFLDEKSHEAVSHPAVPLMPNTLRTLTW